VNASTLFASQTCDGSSSRPACRTLCRTCRSSTRTACRSRRATWQYPAYKVLVEHDGWHHERDAAQRQRDHLRRERLEAEGWLVIVITVEDFRNEKSIAWRVYNALKLRGYAGPTPHFGG
jgi:very-short-patch-repair endonuclease